MISDKYLVDIIILNFNQEADTAECILSLKRMDYKNYRVILVDNGSSDGSGSRLKERFKEIDLLRSDENLGFAGGCNLGIRRSLETNPAGYILLLNNDAVVNERLLDELLGAAETNRAIGVAAAVNYYYSSPETVHMAAHRFFWWLGVQGRLTDMGGAAFKEVQSVSACCMLVKKEVIEKIGVFDERFFMYYEDSDFCLRARRAGFKVAAVRDAKVWHRISAILGTRTPQEYYIYTRNQPLFMLKNCPKIFLPIYFSVYFVKVTLRIVYFFLILRRALSSAVLNGVCDFFMGNFGKGRLFA
jgi:GT2 family glycosyltransferase